VTMTGAGWTWICSFRRTWTMESDMEDEQVPTDEEIVAPGPSETVTVEVIEDEPKDGWRVVHPGKITRTAGAPTSITFVPNAEVVEGEWGGMPAYRCSACPFDSLDRAQTEAHLSIHGMTLTQGA
jgi:hypothetical protein